MDIEAKARLHAIELLVTQLISEYLRMVPDPRGQVAHAGEQLHRTAQQIPIDAADLDEEARLRVRIQDVVDEILQAALRQVQAIPAAPRSWRDGYEGG